MKPAIDMRTLSERVRSEQRESVLKDLKTVFNLVEEKVSERANQGYTSVVLYWEDDINIVNSRFKEEVFIEEVERLGYTHRRHNRGITLFWS